MPSCRMSANATCPSDVLPILAGGGDGFAVPRDGPDRVTGINDVNALASYLGASSPLSPPPLDRICSVP
jgi:5'-nucleotidase